MRRGWRLACVLVALVLAPGVAQSGDAARDGWRRLQTHEQRMRLEDLRTRAYRGREADRLRGVGDPVTIERTLRRWRAEDRQLDFRRDRETEAIGRSVDANERIDSAAERLVIPRAGAPEHASTPDAATAARDAFDRERAELGIRQRLERLRRDGFRVQGPGARRYPP